MRPWGWAGLGRMQQSRGAGRASAGWKGDKAILGSCPAQGGAWGMAGASCAAQWDRRCPCSHRVASNLDGSLKGQYQVAVEARDNEAPMHRVQTVLTVSVTPGLPIWGHPAPSPALLTPVLHVQIFTVDQSYRVRLQFVTTVDEVQSNVQRIKA